MKRLLFFSLVIGAMPAIDGCMTSSGHIKQATSASSVESSTAIRIDATGEQALKDIRTWYESQLTDCGGPRTPAFFCSGVMIRGTKTSPNYYPWDPSPASIENGGVSFSWLRRGHDFGRFAYSYGNGFIFYPKQFVPSGKMPTPEVLCTFPIDADSVNRPTLQGCGPNTHDAANSAPCETLVVGTAEQWLDRNDKVKDYFSGACGWSVRIDENDTSARFQASIRARSMLTGARWNRPDELRLATWATGAGADLPIRAFFYLVTAQGALDNARDDQKRYFNAYHEFVPIIRLALPADPTGATVFAYEDSDQAVSPGPDPGLGHRIDFENVPIGPVHSIKLDEGVIKNGPQGQVEIIDVGTTRWKNVRGHALRAVGIGSMEMELTVPVSSGSFDYAYTGNKSPIVLVWYDTGGFGSASFPEGVKEGRLDLPMKSGSSITSFAISFPEENGAEGYVDNVEVTSPSR